MTDKSDKIVVTIEWEGGSYTGEVCDGIPARPTKYQRLRESFRKLIVQLNRNAPIELFIKLTSGHAGNHCQDTVDWEAHRSVNMSSVFWLGERLIKQIL